MNLTLTNMDVSGARVHLSASDAVRPWLYGASSILYFIAFLAWYCTVTRPDGSSTRIYHIVGVLLFFKSCTALTQAGRYYVLGAVGTSESWIELEVTLRILRGVLLFVITIVVAIGWLTLQPDIPFGEQTIICILMPVQLAACLIKGILDQEGTSTTGFMFWQNVLHGIDLGCFFVMLVPITRLIQHTQAVGNEPLSYKAFAELKLHTNSMYHEDSAVHLNQRLRQLRKVYLVFMLFEFIPRLFVYVWTPYVPYAHIWIIYLLQEVVVLLFYCTICKLALDFLHSSPYLHPNDRKRGPTGNVQRLVAKFGPPPTHKANFGASPSKLFTF
ncbi:hypothetical protein CYMTET_54314 [Cymbomonas tetramitiformis]|uniref:GOST seven transmembrane domain-containing protein n=1 Tax=Cymbomonas tetramitiformis TaxID=36881 RepID=A0AAE0EQU8_9CHLO|nr:hypothetical protein CYMTET_54314 [Cymbomonas tetramitiformis]